MTSDSALNEISVVIRVKIDSCVDVSIRAVTRPDILLPLPPGQGRISQSLIDQFEESFPRDLAQSIGRPEPALLLAAENSIRRHAQNLAQVLWGKEVWIEAAEWERWWQNLISNRDCSSVIELELCPEMRKFIWESLLITPLSLSNFSIVRLHKAPEPDERKDAKPVKIAFDPNPYRDLGDLHEYTQEILQGEGNWHVMHRSPGKSSLEKLREVLNQKRQELLFLYVGHGQVTETSCVFEMVSRDGGPDEVTADRLQTAFGQCNPVVMILVACWLGHSPAPDTSGRLIDLLGMSRITVAMQLPLSVEAADTFLRFFFEGGRLDNPPLIEIVRRVQQARGALHVGEYSFIEASTPVIYSCVSAAAPESETTAGMLSEKPEPEITDVALPVVPESTTVVVIRIKAWIGDLVDGQPVDCKDLIELVRQANDNDLSLLTDPEREFIAFAIMHCVSRN